MPIGNRLRLKLCVPAIFFAFLLYSPTIHATTLSVGPTDNVGAFWIDQDRPNFNIPPKYQKWGFVFTVPTGETFLNSATFFVRSQVSADDDATFYKIKLREWDDVNSRPVGPLLFESAPVLFADLDPASPDTEWGTPPTKFSVSATVIANKKYIFEILGDGRAGVNLATGYQDGGLFEAFDTSPIDATAAWLEFGATDLRTEITFSAIAPVDIDIKPGSDPNSINLCSNGAVPVAILGSETFDVLDINTELLRFADAAVKVVGKKDQHTVCTYEDVNLDGFTDLVCHFITTDIAGVDGESTTATVNGELDDGTLIEGTDSIDIVKDTCN